MDLCVANKAGRGWQRMHTRMYVCSLPREILRPCLSDGTTADILLNQIISIQDMQMHAAGCHLCTRM